MFICIVTFFHSRMLFHCIPPSLPLLHPFPSYRSTFSVYLACLPNPSFILFWLLHFTPSLSSLSPLFLSHSPRRQMGTCFPFQFSALIYPLFHSSNQSFAVIHIAIAFLMYLPRWWRQQLPVDHLYTSSAHYMALRSTRWQFQNLSFHECNRNVGSVLRLTPTSRGSSKPAFQRLSASSPSSQLWYCLLSCVRTVTREMLLVLELLVCLNYLTMLSGQEDFNRSSFWISVPKFNGDR